MASISAQLVQEGNMAAITKAAQDANSATTTSTGSNSFHAARTGV